MRKYLILGAILIAAWFDDPTPGIAQATGLIAGITLALGAVSTGYGMYQTSKAGKANKKNQSAYNEAMRLNEKEARLIYDDFIKQYNASAEKLEEGLSIEEYIGRMVKALNDPQLEESYRKARRGDWAMAQEFADQANKQNISAFDMLVDRVSGGDYDEFIKLRNKTIFSENAEDIYKEASRLRAPKTPAGSVIKPEAGRKSGTLNAEDLWQLGMMGGQRADKQDFLASVSSVRDYNKTTLGNVRTAIEDDRVAAQRQQQRASEFLPLLDYSSFTAQNVVQPFNQQSLQAQLAKLQIEGQMASNALAGITGAPQAPPTIDTSASQALTAQGTQMALAGLASYYKNNPQIAANDPKQNPFLKSEANYIPPSRGGYDIPPTSYTGKNGYLS